MSVTESLRLAIDARRAKQGANDYVASGNRITDASNKMSGAVNTTDDKINRLGNTAKSAMRIVGGLFASIGATVAVQQSIKTIASFEETMAVFHGVTMATTEQLEVATVAARELGATTRYTASEAAQGLVNLAKSGFSVEESVKAIPSVLRLAQAGLVSLDEASTIAANSLRQFGLDVSQTSHVVDVLVNTANRSNTEVHGLAEGLAYAGPVAAAFGRTIEETAAALGVLGNSGIDASMGGTELRSVMAGLTSTSEKARVTIRRMGLTLEDLNPSTHSIVDIMRKLRDANMSAGEAVEIFDQRAAAGALVIMRNVEAMEELRKSNEMAMGIAEELARIQEDTLTGSFNSLKSAMQEVMLQAGDAGLAGAIRKIVDIATELIRDLSGTSTSTQKYANEVKTLKTAFAALGEVLAVVVAIKIGSILYSVGTAAVAAGKYVIALATNLYEVVTAAWAVKGAILSSMTTVIGAIAGVVAAIAVAFAGFEIGKFFYSEFKIVQQAGQWVSMALLSIWEGIKFAFKSLVMGLKQVWNDFASCMVDTLATTFDLISGAFDKLPSAIKKVMPSLNEAKQGADILAKSLHETASGYRTDWDEQTKGLVADFEKQMAILKEADANVKAQIEKDFAGKSSKGQGWDVLGAQVLGDVEKAKSAFMGLFATEEEGIKHVAQVAKEASIVYGPEDNPEHRQKMEHAKAEAELLAARREAEIDEMIQKVQQETAMIGKSNLEREHTKLLEEARIAAEDAGLDQMKVFIKQQEISNALREKYQQIGEEALEKQTLALEKEASTSAMTALAREQAAETSKAQEVIDANLVDNAQDYLDRIREAVTLKHRMAAEKTVEEAIRALQQEIALMGQSNLERERTLALQQAEKNLGEAESQRKQELLEQLREEYRLKGSMQHDVTLAEVNRNLALERNYLTLNNDEREVQQRMNSLRLQNAQTGIDMSEDELALIEEKIRANQRLRKTMETYGAIAQGVGNTVADEFEKMVWEAKSMQDAVEDLTRSIARMVYQELVTKQIASAISGAVLAGFSGFQATGTQTAGGGSGAITAGLRGGGLTGPQASGGILTEPVSFIGAHSSGIAGEDGPEAIIPLARGPDGSLGIRSTGTERSSVFNQTVNMQITTPNADSFRKSNRQVRREMTSASKQSAGRRGV